MVQFFLDHGANTNAVSYDEETPLHLALRQNVHGTKYQDDWTRDHWRGEYVLDLIDPEDDDADEIYADAIKWRKDVIDKLLGHSKIDVNIQDSKGASALHYAPYGKEKCHIIVKTLVEKGAEVSAWNSRKQSPLHLACKRGDSASTRVLLRHGANILYADDDGLNSLHYAAMSGNVETMLLVLKHSDEHGLNICISRDKMERNALHHGLTGRMTASSDERARLLLDNGIDIKDKDVHGNSPLATYLMKPRLFINNKICRLLLESGSDAMAINGEGLALAHLASRCIELEATILEILMEFGADMEILDRQGRTVYITQHSKVPLLRGPWHFFLKKQSFAMTTKTFLGKHHRNTLLKRRRDPVTQGPLNPAGG
ncbi:hypothetical protein G7Y89_g846 [Cudoniella acicularis]|uniref:Uncharacterized protein n=1 Tax=Cudoniella acicularis TaxID=354080 RepID=A0A8H4W8H3_9HELO|nr:hypothetical protein G7Y89_g846 [Cudoniella acicularis]